MLTRVEIDGFKTFENLKVNLQPFVAIVGPNATGKSNFFDALRFLSRLAELDVREAMTDLRGRPEELFRQTASGLSDRMKFAVEVLLEPEGIDSFGRKYEIKSRRLRYEIGLILLRDNDGVPRSIVVNHEKCEAIAKENEVSDFIKKSKAIQRSYRKNAFIEMSPDDGEYKSFIVRQDGPSENQEKGPKRGRPMTLPAAEASRSALSTIATAEFPHLYALRELLRAIRFLEINPQAARKASDRFEKTTLKPDASNLAAVLANLKERTATPERPDGAVNDISLDLASLIPSVQAVEVFNDVNAKEYSFGVKTTEKLQFSARVISDGTLRLLALLTVLNDPEHRGVLCFEEPENGVHEGRLPALIAFLREAAAQGEDLAKGPLFQILVNTHSPAVMAALEDDEIIAADAVRTINPETGKKAVRTRMRTGLMTNKLVLDPETDLNRQELASFLRREVGAA
jgi:predicted ATPase